MNERSQYNIYAYKLIGDGMQILSSGSWFRTKKVMQRGIRNVGFEIRKFPLASFRPVSVFHLAVQLLMAKKGESLKFAQVGANDGVFVDPLRQFITMYPWRGILVEPQPDIFDRLVNNYKEHADRLIFENVAISNDKSGLVLYKAPSGLVKDGVYASSVASSNPNVVAKQLKIPINQLEKIITPSMTLDELLEKHGLVDIDVLQIDVEGYDWQVLRTLNLDRTAPSIIQFESGHLSHGDCDSVVEHLTKHGYEIYWGGNQGDALALKGGLFS